MAKAPPKKEDKQAEAPAEGEDQPPKKKGKLPLVLGLVVLLAVGGGAWFFMFKDKGGDGDTAQQQVRTQPPKPPVFVPLDAFTVNLSAEQGDQYLQVAATLKVLDQPAADIAKQYMPEVRHRTLILLSSKKAAEVASAEGRERLAEEIRQTANNILLAAAGRPVVALERAVPRPARAEPPPADPGPENAAVEAPKTAEGDKPQEGAAAEAATPAAAQAVPAVAPPAPKPVLSKVEGPATMLSKAATDDPVQSVFFTSFIIQ